MTAHSAADRRRHVLHIVDDLGPGGMQKNLLQIVEQTRDRYVHSICCIRDRGSLADRFEATGLEVVCLDKARGHDWAITWRIAQLCRRLRPDIVHTRNWGAVDGIAGAWLARVPAIIHSEHGWDTATVPARRGWVFWGLSPVISAIVAVSDQLRRWFCEDVGLAPAKVRVVRNGVDANRFRPRLERDRLRYERGYEDGQCLVLAVGRLDPIKNYPLLMRAFEEVMHRAPQARLLIVGEGPERNRIEDDIAQRRLGSVVRLAGHQSDIEDWFAAADVFVHTALWEGMTNAALEAMASGLPIVATRVGGLQEIVVDGVSGRLVDGGNGPALAAAITSYCADAAMRSKHGKAGRARAVAEFSPQEMIAAYVRLYDEVLAGEV